MGGLFHRTEAVPGQAPGISLPPGVTPTGFVSQQAAYEAGSAILKEEQGAIQFQEHGVVASRVDHKVDEGKKGLGSGISVVGKAAEASTISARHGTEELIEVLTTPQGRKFVRTMAAMAIEGYLQVSTSEQFCKAASLGASAATRGSVNATQEWLLGWWKVAQVHLDPTTAALVSRGAGLLLVSIGGLLLALTVGLMLLVWKVVLFGV